MAADRADDVGRGQGDVLDARTAVGVEVLGDLALLEARGRLVDGHDDAGAVVHHRAAQGRVLRRDLVGVEVAHLAEAQHLDVPGHPVVKAALLDVAHDVVDRLQSDRGAGGPRRQAVGR